MFIYALSILLTSTAFVSTNAKYGIPLSRYTVFLQNCPLGHDPKPEDFSECYWRLKYGNNSAVIGLVDIISDLVRLEHFNESFDLVAVFVAFLDADDVCVCGGT